MNILLISPNINLRNGPSVWAKNLAKELARRKISVTVLTLGDKLENIPTYTHKAKILERKILKYPIISIKKTIMQVVKQRKVDLIHTSNLLIGGLGAIFAKRINVPVVVTIHGLYFDEIKEWSQSYFKILGRLGKPLTAMSSFILSRIGMYVARRADLVTVPSAYLKKHLDEKKINSVVIPNAVDVSSFSVRDAALISNTSNKKIILTITNMNILNKTKGLKILFETIKLLESKHNIELWVAGTGKHKEDLEDYCVSEGLSVKFLGYREDISRLLKKANVYVHASLQETSSFAILEAMTLRTPVVAIGTGGIPEIIKNKYSGLITKPDSVEIKRKIEEILANKTLTNRMITNAAKIVSEKFDIKKVANRYLDLYKKILNN